MFSEIANIDHKNEEMAKFSKLFAEIKNIRHKNEEIEDSEKEAISHNIGADGDGGFKNENTSHSAELEMCQTLLLRKYIVHWARTVMSGGKKNKKIKKIIEKYARANGGINFKLPFGEGDYYNFLG